MFTHEISLSSSWFIANSIGSHCSGAKTRRAIVRTLYGDWFAEHGLKLTRDYMVRTTRDDSSPYGSGHNRNVKIKITINDPSKALLFKLTWGGK